MFELLNKFEEDDRFVNYRPVKPITIFHYKVEPSDCIISISKSLDWTEVAPILKNYLQWLTICKNEVIDYFQSRLADCPEDWEDWFKSIEVYNVDITFLALDDFGATIRFGENIFPDHTIEIDLEQYEIISERLNG